MDAIAIALQGKMIMREILFRGKRTDNGEWVEGNLVPSPNADEGYQAIIIPCYYNYMYTSDYNNDVGFETWYKVEPETVGEFTGMTDKNGKMIFEGDIVIHHNDNPFVKRKEKGHVFWDENSLRWRRTTNHVTHLGKMDSYVLSSSCIYEVIGNIHDNPELLKGEGK